MLMELLKSGCSLQDAIAFLPGDVTWLNDKLQAGEEFSTILQEDNRPWIRHFTFFLSYEFTSCCYGRGFTYDRL